MVLSESQLRLLKGPYVGIQSIRLIMSHLFSLLKSLPVQLALGVLFSACFGHSLDLSVIRFFFSLSNLFVDGLMVFLPFIVFVYIFCSIVGLDRRSPIFVALLLGGVTISNLIALFTSYSISFTCLPFISIPNVSGLLGETQSAVTPLWHVTLPKLFGTDKALLFGVISGMVISFLSPTSMLKMTVVENSLKIRDRLTQLLQKLFIPLLPLYILGFSLKISYDGSLLFLFSHYTQVFLLSVAVVFGYLALLYTLASGLKWQRFVGLIQRMLPAGIAGFSTMSSAAAMPVTLASTEQNTGDKELTNLVIPATSNIHMLGDDLTIVLTAMTLLLMNGQSMPDFSTFLLFSGAFCLAKLSCVGIPGASVLVILPVLEQFLGFNPTMIGMLTAIYILQDPIGTFTNVMGNGAFAVMMQRAFKVLNFKKVPSLASSPITK